MMNFREKALYHQIHPPKLLADWGTGLISAFFGSITYLPAWQLV
jgi:hypothetical protein